jgi:restriction system protein
MAIPTFDQLFRPVLELAAKEPITLNTATESMCQQHSLTAQELAHRLPSGGQTIRNRTGWAMTFLKKASLISKVASRTYQATERGKEFLKQHQSRIRESDLKAIPGYREAWAAGSARRQEKEAAANGKIVTATESTATPHEIIAREVQALRADLRGRLLEAIVEQSPGFFETLVLDVLTKMGYGGSREDAAEHLGQSGDEGIDGRINQDSLGLDQVLVQAKRYRPDRTVDRQEVQAFIGSLSGQGVTKGVFITTSRIAPSAREFVARGSTTKIVLVDGEMLIDLMLRHKIGVRTVQTHEIQELDQNYFEEGE